MVRQRTLTPSFGGSNPPSPGDKKALFEKSQKVLFYWKKVDFKGFFGMRKTSELIFLASNFDVKSCVFFGSLGVHF